MKNILFIGGPKTVQGVDRIDDDLLSIITAEGLYDRKAVVVWPTEEFLAKPQDPKVLADACNMELAELIAVSEKKLIPFGGVTTAEYRELVPEVRKDAELMDAAVDICARSQAYAALSKLVLSVSGGQNLVVVLSSSATTKAVSWLTYPTRIDIGQCPHIKAYKSADSGYGVLNAVSDWSRVFHGPASGSVKAGDLVPRTTFLFNGEQIFYDPNSYMGVENALSMEVEISYPVTDRFNGARAIKVSGDKGYMLVVPEPDKIKNFIIGLKTTPKAKSKTDDSVPKPSKVATDQYMIRKDVAELLNMTTRTVDRRIADGKLKTAKVGSKVLILKSSVDKLLEG
jgi:excisionase family DNA binding protein